MTFYQQTTLPEKTYRWPVDVTVAGKVMGWAKRNPDLFLRDLEGMRDYFPHWLVVGGDGQQAIHCPDCTTFCVPTAGAIRCLKCGRGVKAKRLLWVGHIPALARPETEFVKKQQMLREAGFAEVTTSSGTYLLVPLSATYPTEWPNVEPEIRYPGRWLKTLELPLSHGGYHLINRGQACIFAWGQWQAMAIHTVLQQRMVNHIVSLFKIVAGQSPGKAFIGRIHNQPWEVGD